MREEDLGSRSVPRNPLLFSMLYRMKLVEQIGSGIRRIRDAWLEHGVREPAIEVSPDWLTVTFPRSVEPVAPPCSPSCDAPCGAASCILARGDEPGRTDESCRVAGPQTLCQDLPATKSWRGSGRDDAPRQSNEQNAKVPADRPG